MKKYQLIEKRYDKEQNAVGNFKNRYFFRKDDDEICYKLDAHIDYMILNGLCEMDLYLAERETNVPFFLLPTLWSSWRKIRRWLR